MESKKAAVLVAAAIATVLVLLAVLCATAGPRSTLFLAFAAASAAILTTTLLFILIYRATSACRHHRSDSCRLSSNEGRQSRFRIEYSFLRKVAGLPVSFRYEDLESATDHFHTPIGRGSSGSVFRGVLEDGTPVAVKRIELPQEQGDKEFRSEIAAVASIHHVNLVRLLGFCLHPAAGWRFLVYEFARHGSLDRWIFPRKFDEGRCLSWTLRVRVAVEVAKALAYLHHDCRSKVLHLDVKPENVLLDEGFHAMVADFGLSRMMGREERWVTTGLRGQGVFGAGLLMEKVVTEKSDVYSYGMVLLEIVGGRRSLRLLDEEGEGKWSYFPEMVVDKVRGRKGDGGGGRKGCGGGWGGGGKKDGGCGAVVYTGGRGQAAEHGQGGGYARGEDAGGGAPIGCWQDHGGVSQYAETWHRCTRWKFRDEPT
ncbi:hypothetical protein HPP92_008452 [Vanilla planifolia]|uniref:Protein kinase domain-containing protein n=1 Tax=Vanilla planifolia TaxID=51239 RepID=A0A835RI10_VANPL|nr:hypothetical protein HPP92_008452 [Vanilla planifolia]